MYRSCVLYRTFLHEQMTLLLRRTAPITETPDVFYSWLSTIIRQRISNLILNVQEDYYIYLMCFFVNKIFCVVMLGLTNVNILYYSFSTLYQMCNLLQSLWVYKTNHTSAACCPGRIADWTSSNTRWDRVGETFDPLPYE